MVIDEGCLLFLIAHVLEQFLFILNLLLNLCLLTGAVGLPLPGVEVRIVMNNTTNTTIVEGNRRETQVINKCACYVTPFISLTAFAWTSVSWL